MMLKSLEKLRDGFIFTDDSYDYHVRFGHTQAQRLADEIQAEIDR